MTIETKDVPRENLFMIGIVQENTTRDLFVIARPRRPFIVSRAEALNVIGYLVTHADFTVKDIEDVISMWKPDFNIFDVRGDESRAILSPAINARVFHASQTDFERSALVQSAEMGLFLFNMEEGKILAASLTHVMSLKPKELDAGVVAIFEHARNASGFGQDVADMLKTKLSDA